MSLTDRETLPVWLGWTRLAIGLAQGVALYFINDLREATDPALFAALWVTMLFAPVALIGGLGAIRPIVLATWIGGATLVVAGLAAYGASRTVMENWTWEYAQLYVVAPIFLFVGHHLVAAGDEARKWIAPYERYFDLGSRHVAQLALAVAFTGAFWAVLILGSQLFNLIGITLLVDLLDSDWFAMPATTGVFAAAIHLTDMRSGLVRGTRALGLTLLAWLLPAMAFLAAAFFLALPFTGVQPLWETRAATAILLGSAAALVILVNAAYQDGEHPPGLILRWSARVAAVLMTPLAVLAAYALWLRIDQYGLTPERIYAAAVLVVGGCYAVAYSIGAFQSRWMRTLEVGNVASAFVMLVVVVALFSPIADPARLSVADQMRRLESGRIAPEDFDVVFLRFDGARYGDAALRQLVADRSSEEAIALGERARRVLALNERWAAQVQNAGAPVELRMHPEGAAPPEGFLDQPDLTGGLMMCRTRDMVCDGMFIDLDGDGRSEFIVSTMHFLSIYAQGDDGRWAFVANASAPENFSALAASGAVRVAPARFGDLIIGDDRVPVTEVEPGRGPAIVSVESEAGDASPAEQ